MGKVLIVDDEPNMRRILKANLRMDNHTCVEASNSSEAVARLSKEDFDVVVTDQKMPGGTGLDVLRAVQESDPTTSVIFLTAVGTVELAVESMRQGAFDFLTKPFEIDVMKATIRRACERTFLLREMLYSERPFGSSRVLKKSSETARASSLCATSSRVYPEPHPPF